MNKGEEKIADVFGKETLNRSIATSVKRKFYKMVVRPVMMYGLDTVNLTRREEAKKWQSLRMV